MLLEVQSHTVQATVKQQHKQIIHSSLNYHVNNYGYYYYRTFVASVSFLTKIVVPDSNLSELLLDLDLREDLLELFGT